MRRSLMLIVCAMCMHSAIAGNVESGAQRELGLAEYEIGHYAIAASHFQRAAEMGDARAAEMLALMYRFGEWLYGGQIPADPALASYWASVAADLRFCPLAKGRAAVR